MKCFRQPRLPTLMRDWTASFFGSFFDGPIFLSPTQADPDEFLRAIGRISVEWGHLERALEELLCRLVGMQLHEGVSLVTHIPFRTRLEIANAYASRRSQIPDALKAELKELLDEINTKRRGRNDCVRGEWGVYRSGGQVDLSVYTAHGRVKWRSGFPTAAYMEAFADEIIALNDRFRRMAGKLAQARGLSGSL